MAQRAGMAHVGPFTYTGIRFALGAIVLLPLLLVLRPDGSGTAAVATRRFRLQGGLLTGLVLFMAASIQQIGIIYTTAGNAGFITGLYVVLVPLLGLFWRQRPDAGTWLGVVLAAAGMYFLTVTAQLTVNPGDLLIMSSTVLWAAHVLIIAWLARRIYPLELAFMQFVVCSVLSLVTAVLLEVIRWQSILDAAIPILYGGVISVGIAYTLQVVAQREAHPAHAAILMSLETVFAALGGYLILNEVMSGRGLTGCLLMLAGMLISQLWGLYQLRIKKEM